MRAVVSLRLSVGWGAGRGGDGSCPVLKVAPVGRNVRVAVMEEEEQPDNHIHLKGDSYNSMSKGEIIKRLDVYM